MDRRIESLSWVICCLLLLSGCGPSSAALEEAREQGYQDGYAVGMSDGKEIGYETGYGDGKSDGRTEGFVAGQEEAIYEIRELLQCEEDESIEEHRNAMMEFHLRDGYNEGYNDACLNLPHFYHSDFEDYQDAYWEVYDPETGELKPEYEAVLQQEIERRNTVEK